MDARTHGRTNGDIEALADAMRALKNKSSIFSLTALTSQIVEFVFSNVAYGPTVYKTGH